MLALGPPCLFKPCVLRQTTGCLQSSPVPIADDAIGSCTPTFWQLRLVDTQRSGCCAAFPIPLLPEFAWDVRGFGSAKSTRPPNSLVIVAHHHDSLPVRDWHARNLCQPGAVLRVQPWSRAMRQVIRIWQREGKLKAHDYAQTNQRHFSLTSAP
jgi:hypothetical protein